MTTAADLIRRYIITAPPTRTQLWIGTGVAIAVAAVMIYGAVTAPNGIRGAAGAVGAVFMIVLAGCAWYVRRK